MRSNTLTHLPEHSPSWLTNFFDIYQKLSTNNLDLLSTIYHPDVTFIDPIHHVEGYDELFNYFKNLYENLSACNFVIQHIIYDGKQATVYWEMTYIHKKLNKGHPVTVQGCSHLQGQDDKVIYHRDYLDLGAMLYEQLPVIGRFIKWIKTKAAS
jgi:limonene-1,2-epoxide hydrolase